MPSEWQWYLGNRDSFLRDRTEELEGALHSARAREQRERDRLQKTLDQRFEQLAGDLQLLLELSDLRDELGDFDHYELIRRQARILLGSLEIVGAARRRGRQRNPLTSLDGDEDYWLAYAARALPDLMASPGSSEPGDEGWADHPDVAAARALDPGRTDRFLLLALLLAGRGERAAGLLPGALGPTERAETTAVQRALWTVAADGALGPAGRDELIRWLRANLAGSGGRPDPAPVNRWHGALSAAAEPFRDELPLSVRRRHRALLQPLGRALAAVESLSDLADRYRRAQDAWRQPSQAPPSPAPLASAPATEGQTGSTIGDVVTGPGPDVTLDGPWNQLRWSLITLVDEGIEDEAPLLRRVERIRRQLQASTGSDGPAPAPPASDPEAVVGLLGDLVMADAAGRSLDGAAPATGSDTTPAESALSAVAWRVDDPGMAELCAALHRTALDLPDTDPVIPIMVGDSEVAVSGGPTNPPELEAVAAAAAAKRYPPAGGLLSALKEDNSEERQRYQKRIMDDVEAIRTALAAVTARLAEARMIRARLATDLAPLGIGQAAGPP